MPFILFVYALLLLPLGPVPGIAATAQAPVLSNPGFECTDGYHDQAGIDGMVPNGWTAKVLAGSPYLGSTQFWESMGASCEASPNNLEKVEGYDSNVFLAAPAPAYSGFDAPPFDVALYQPAEVTPGAEYSLSVWMVSLCGGSQDPSDCPAGAYIAKMAGLDPTGGMDATSSTVNWIEDRRPHVEARWVNLSVAGTAASRMLTVFVRVKSPFHWHGNHAFADAVKLVRAPNSRFEQVSAQGNTIAVSWTGDLGPDIPAIPSPGHDLWFELQVQRGRPMGPWLSREAKGGKSFDAPRSCRDETYRFRIRAWGNMSAWPYNQFVGVWHESAVVEVAQALVCPYSLDLPQASR